MVIIWIRGLGFMSLIILGLFLTLCGEINIALVAFALAGGLLGFLYYNFNPARIFMGDTGSLVLGFVTAVLTIHLIQLNTIGNFTLINHVPVFGLSLVLIPVFDTLRVFCLRIWRGKSPFDPDKTHIHHLLTNNGWSHNFAAKLICVAHGLILIIGYFFEKCSPGNRYPYFVWHHATYHFCFSKAPSSCNKKNSINLKINRP